MPLTRRAKSKTDNTGASEKAEQLDFSFFASKSQKPAIPTQSEQIHIPKPTKCSFRSNST